jgi:hypothetical protein
MKEHDVKYYEFVTGDTIEIAPGRTLKLDAEGKTPSATSAKRRTAMTDRYEEILDALVNEATKGDV